jgi:hypothetical protein
MADEERWGWVELHPKAKTNGYSIKTPKHEAVIPENVEHKGERLNGTYYVNVYFKSEKEAFRYNDSDGKPTIKPRLKFKNGNTNEQGVILPVIHPNVTKVGISIPPSEVCEDKCHHS